MNAVEDQEVQLHSNNNTANDHSTNVPEIKNLIDFDPYPIAPKDHALHPVLTPIKVAHDESTNNVVPTSDVSFKPQDVVTELLPIRYQDSLPHDLQYLFELNSISTALPLYAVYIGSKCCNILIDSGASESYVSPHVVSHLGKDKFIPVYDRQIETASGMVSQIKSKVNLDISLNGFQNKVSAYVFPAKFDLILGRACLKQTKPIPYWSTDLCYLKNGSIKLKPYINNSSHSQNSTPALNYLISHRQASRYIKKGGYKLFNVYQAYWSQ